MRPVYIADRIGTEEYKVCTCDAYIADADDEENAGKFSIVNDYASELLRHTR